MADRTFSFDETLAAYRSAGYWWGSLVGGIEAHQWALPALGEWNVRELVAHTSRAFTTVTDYATGDVKDPTRIETAAEYFRTVLAEQTPHVHIAARARTEVASEPDWIDANDRRWSDASQVVANLAGDHDMHTFVGEMSLDQYLATRVVEVVVHGLDLSAAIGIPSHPPIGAARVAVDVLLDLSTGDDVASVLRLLTGRPADLPLANVLA